MVNLGALTTTFTPSDSCSSFQGYTAFATDDGYYFVQGGLVKDCFPSDYDPSGQYFYSPGVCPRGYTVACSSMNQVDTLTETISTCCPT